MADDVTYHPLETESLLVVRRMQCEKLTKQLARLHRVNASYRARLGTHSPEIRSMADLDQLDFTTRADLLPADESSDLLGPLTSVPPEAISRIYSTSGSTGAHAHIGLTRADRRDWDEVGARVLWCVGLRDDDLVATTLLFGLFSGGLPILGSIDRIGAGAVPVGPAPPEQTRHLLERTAVTFLLCSTSYALLLAEQLARLDTPMPSLRRVMVGTEPGADLPHVAALLRDRFAVPITAGMGAAELMPLHSGMCGRGPGMHLLAPDHVLMEIIDPATGQRLEFREGVEGELVASHLQRECSPLVRYRTGDIVTVAGVDCACGRTGPRIVCRGRASEAIKAPSGTAFPSDFHDLIVGLVPHTTGAFELVLRHDAAVLRLEYGPTVTDLAAVGARVDSALQARFDRTWPIEWAAPGSLPRYDRKARRLRRSG